MIVAPATANVLGKIAYGIADDALTTTFAAMRKPVVIAPAMNDKMYQSPATQQAINILSQWENITMLDCADGPLACGTSGKGRMQEIEVIAAAAEYALTPKTLLGKQILITAGPTQEAIDPVRYISNASTGKMGYALVRTCLNRMGGKMFRVTADEMNWQPGHKRKGEIKVMSAGGKKKDGLGASQVHADEHGSAEYINGNSDMQGLVDVCWGSTGPRREKLLLHTTTAGRIQNGPYKQKLEQVEASLEQEMNYPLGEPHRTDEDVWTAFLLQLDKPEITDDLTKLDDPELFKKCNRSIGTTVQPTYYRERLHEAATGTEDTKQEVLTKDLNIWQQGKVTKWITGDRIRPLQVPKRITDCRYQDGWQKIFVGMDFSHGDDLFAHAYLAVNYIPTATPQGHIFADCDAWILEKALNESPNRPLYEQWIKDGWLHVCPGEVFNPAYAINRIASLAFEQNEQGDIDFMRPRLNFHSFGYDPAQSIDPINQLKAWLQTALLHRSPDASPKDLADIIQAMVIPVSQSAMSQTPIIGHLETLILNNPPLIEFSPSPLWPWCFGNCAVEMGNSDLRRIVKGSGQFNKIDVVAALEDAMHLFDVAEGRIEQ